VALNGDEMSACHLDRFILCDRAPGTHFTGILMGLKDGLNSLNNIKIKTRCPSLESNHYSLVVKSVAYLPRYFIDFLLHCIVVLFVSLINVKNKTSTHPEGSQQTQWHTGCDRSKNT
jgi:hypothetical protein